MKPATGVIVLLSAFSLIGCSRNGELEKARAEAVAAKTDLAKLTAELDQLKAQRTAQQSEESKVMEVAKEFIDLLCTKRSDKAYQLASASLRKKSFPQGLPAAAELRASDPLLNKHPAIMELEQSEYRQHKLKKADDGKTYEYFCHAQEYWPRTLAAAAKNYNAFPAPPRDGKGSGPWVELTLIIIQEDGSWKVDSIDVDTEVP
jgi:hypothetical protein